MRKRQRALSLAAARKVLQRPFCCKGQQHLLSCVTAMWKQNALSSLQLRHCRGEAA